ncbi:hypothetical protein RHMOL_Rhmol05G0019500 [Rhododendron molle]|uniref:Uncharacterized protein n=2 Tax=Rhododendron molle TaxID=49168 RepID=A0ACC0NKD1_RHOML|nr:hypothetical protein RHMOL_Rhmol05G0019500 [Rhododendron molle]KAI8553486.1 hypothetical protein RHMOL_Rhmol05G0019500 [Rhododendron molle]
MHLEEVSSRIEVPNLIGSLGCWPTKHLPAAWLVERSLSLLFSLLGFLSLYTIAQPFTGSIELIESISHGVADRSPEILFWSGPYYSLKTQTAVDVWNLLFLHKILRLVTYRFASLFPISVRLNALTSPSHTCLILFLI